MVDHVPVINANGHDQAVAAGNTQSRPLSIVESTPVSIKPTSTRIRIEISHGLLNICRVHQDWAKFWLLVPQEVATVAELLAALWRMLLLDVNPQVKLSYQGFYIPTSSSVEILREGDVVLVQLWSEEATFDIPTGGSLHVQSMKATADAENRTVVAGSLCLVTITASYKKILQEHAVAPSKQAVQQLSPTKPLPKTAPTTPQPTGNLTQQQVPSNKAARTGPSRNARRKKLKRKLRREGILPAKVPRALQPSAANGHAGKRAAPAGAAASPREAMNGAGSCRAPAEGGSTGQQQAHCQGAAARDLRASTQHRADGEQQRKRSADWAAFLSRSTTTAAAAAGAASSGAAAALQAAQPSSSSSSSEEESSSDEDDAVGSVEGGRREGTVRGLRPLGPVQQPLRSEPHLQQESSDEEESSEDEEVGEGSSSAEEEGDDSGGGRAQPAGKGVAAGAAVTASQLQHPVGATVVHAGRGAVGVGRGQGGMSGASHGGARSHAAAAKLAFEATCDEDEEARHLEPSDSSGRFASEVEPWLAAHSQAQHVITSTKQHACVHARAGTSGGSAMHASAAAAAAAEEDIFAPDVAQQADAAACRSLLDERALAQLVVATEAGEELVGGPGSLPPQVAEGGVLMYKVAELNPACMPWVSGWRFGMVRSTAVAGVGGEAGVELQLAPWPDEAAHPLKRAWGALAGGDGGPQVMSRGKGRGRNLDSDDACNAWIHDSMHYDPITGRFSGLWAMDIVSAKLVQPAAAAAAPSPCVRHATTALMSQQSAFPPPPHPSVAGAPQPLPSAAATASQTRASGAPSPAPAQPAAAAVTHAGTATHTSVTGAVRASATSAGTATEAAGSLQLANACAAFPGSAHSGEACRVPTGDAGEGPPVAQVNAEAEAALGASLGALWNSSSSPQHTRKQRRGHSSSGARGARNHASQRSHQGFDAAPSAAQAVPRTPAPVAAEDAVALVAQRGPAGAGGRAAGAPASCPPLATSLTPPSQRSPHGLLQVLQLLEAKKAELRQSAEPAAAAHEGQARGLQAGTAGSSGEGGSQVGAQKRAAEQGGDQQQDGSKRRCKSASSPRVEARPATGTKYNVEAEYGWCTNDGPIAEFRLHRLRAQLTPGSFL